MYLMVIIIYPRIPLIIVFQVSQVTVTWVKALESNKKTLFPNTNNLSKVYQQAFPK